PGDAHRAPVDAGLQRRDHHARGEAGRHRVPRRPARGLGGRPLARLARPRQRGPVGLDRRNGPPRRGRSVDRSEVLVSDYQNPRSPESSHREVGHREQHGSLDTFPDPGLPEHKSRQADRDPRAAKRAERQVATLFGISAIGTIVALVVYFVIPPDGTTAGVRLSTLALGLAIAFALLGIGFGAVHWAKVLMSD